MTRISDDEISGFQEEIAEEITRLPSGSSERRLLGIAYVLSCQLSALKEAVESTATPAKQVSNSPAQPKNRRSKK
jgi:hypothetical protein